MGEAVHAVVVLREPIEVEALPSLMVAIGSRRTTEALEEWRIESWRVS
jgi:hypothetical protein